MNYYFDWLVDNGSGWGIIAANLVKYGALAGHNMRFLGRLAAKPYSLGALDNYLLTKFEADSHRLSNRLAAGEVIADYGRPILRAMGAADFNPDLNATSRIDNRLTLAGAKTIGMLVSEDSVLNRQGAARLAGLVDGIICGSEWNAEVLAKADFPKDRLFTVHQGFDDEYFFPHSQVRRQDGYFYFFSGGKIELRKGQDLVLEAFSEVWRRYPHCRLVTAWSFGDGGRLAAEVNDYKMMQHPWVIENGIVNIKQTAASYGIPAEAIIELPPLKNHEFPNILRFCHAGVFPNRCEGGTNLVAMEAMACGLPCVIADNTGQKDLLKMVPAMRPLALIRSRRLEVKTDAGTHLTELEARMLDWGWPYHSDLIEKMCNLVTNYAEFAPLGIEAAAAIKSYSWSNQIRRLLQQADNIKQVIAHPSSAR